MMVRSFQIMKYYRIFFSEFKINIAIPMSRASIFSCYMIMISCFIISCSKQFVSYSAFIARFKTSFYYRRQDFYLKVFHHFFAIFIFFKNCSNKFIECIFSSVKKKWFDEFNQYTQLCKKYCKEYVLDTFWYKKDYYLHHRINQHKSSMAQLIAWNKY